MKVIWIVLTGVLLASYIATGDETGTVSSHNDEMGQMLTVEEATKLAVSLANDSCEKRFDARPFSPAFDTASMKDSLWRWGRHTPEGIDGYSAIVTFESDGANPVVELFYSVDTRTEMPVSEKKEKAKKPRKYIVK
jgi:hypothetical protein